MDEDAQRFHEDLAAAQRSQQEAVEKFSALEAEKIDAAAQAALELQQAQQERQQDSDRYSNDVQRLGRELQQARDERSQVSARAQSLEGELEQARSDAQNARAQVARNAVDKQQSQEDLRKAREHHDALTRDLDDLQRQKQQADEN